MPHRRGERSANASSVSFTVFRPWSEGVVKETSGALADVNPLCCGI